MQFNIGILVSMCGLGQEKVKGSSNLTAVRQS